MIPYGRQEITDDDIKAVVEVLKSDFITQGPQIPRFEEAVTAYCNARAAAAVSSGTAALHLACRALDVGPGDVVWTSPNSFVASANCARYCGADVDFVDIDPQTMNLSVDALAERLASASKAGRLPKAVIPVHFAGQPCDLEPIADLADEFGFRVIEDASHAIGAEYQGARIGSCTYSDLTVFSFHPVKLITTGEGGMVLGKEPSLVERVKQLRSHGIVRDRNAEATKDRGDWYYELVELGFNYRMTDIQATLGYSQLRRIDQYVDRRRELAGRYTELLSELPLRLPVELGERRSAWHLYVVRIDQTRCNVSRGRAYSALRDMGVGVNVHYIPIHLHPYYRALGFAEGYCPAAEHYYREAITLPLFPTLSGSEQEHVVRSMKTALQ